MVLVPNAIPFFNLKQNSVASNFSYNDIYFYSVRFLIVKLESLHLHKFLTLNNTKFGRDYKNLNILDNDNITRMSHADLGDS